MTDTHTEAALSLSQRVRMIDRDYEGEGVVVELHPPDDRPAYRGQSWYAVRWDETGDVSDHRAEGRFGVEPVR